MTDNEIKKALEICASDNLGCEDGCPYVTKSNSCSLKKDTLDLINRLQAENLKLLSNLTSLQNDLTDAEAENERLKKSNEMFADIGKLYSEIKAEAYKEFAERLKIEYAKDLYSVSKETGYFVNRADIDNLLKEMVGE